MEQAISQKVKSPQLRDRLIQHVVELSDADYQKRFWENGETTNSIPHDEVGYSISFLFDDTLLAERPESLVGIVLLDEREVRGVRNLTRKIDDALNKHGKNAPDKTLLSSDEWRNVIKAAKDLRLLLKK